MIKLIESQRYSVEAAKCDDWIAPGEILSNLLRQQTETDDCHSDINPEKKNAGNSLSRCREWRKVRLISRTNMTWASYNISWTICNKCKKKPRVACSTTQWNTWWLQKADWLRNIQLKSIKKYCPTTIKTSLKPTMQINKLNENTFREKTKCQHENNETDGNEPESESQPNALTRQVIKMVLFRNEQTIRCQFLCAVWKELTCSVHKISHYSYFRKSRLID